MNLLLDSHKLIYHLVPLDRWLKGEKIFPVYCAVGLTDVCNYRCIFCVYDSLKRKKSYLDKQKLLSVIHELVDSGLKGLFFSGEGEPLLHPDAAEIINSSKIYGVDCALNTNGYFLTKEISIKILKDLTFIRISLNGCNPENYKMIHNAPLHAYRKILDNLECAVRLRKEIGSNATIGVQCIILKENISLIQNLTDDLKNVGVDYLAFKPFLPISSTKYRTGLKLDDSKVVNRLKECEKMSSNEFKVIVRWESLNRYKKRTYDRCLSLPFMIEIDSKGDVYPCGVLLANREYSYGTIYYNTYSEIMASERYRFVTGKIYNELDVHKCMPNCRNDAVNRFLWNIKNPPEHVNFI